MARCNLTGDEVRHPEHVERITNVSITHHSSAVIGRKEMQTGTRDALAGGAAGDDESMMSPSTSWG